MEVSIRNNILAAAIKNLEKNIKIGFGSEGDKTFIVARVSFEVDNPTWYSSID